MLHYANRARVKPGSLFDMTVESLGVSLSLFLRKRSLFRVRLSLLFPTGSLFCE